LHKQVDEAMRKYTDQHPDVVQAKRVIAQLEDERKAQIEKRKEEAAKNPPSAVDRNPVFQQLRISLAESEARVAAARAKLAGYEARYREMQSQAQRVPQVEAQFAELNRDYDVQKKTYDSLLARRESATMGIGVQDVGGAQFRVIDPPRVTPQPVAPNRFMLLGIACAASVLIGLAAAFVASQIMPTFHDARALRAVTTRPILGMVSMLPSAAVLRMRRRAAYLFVGGVGGLIASFGAILITALISLRVAS
jgi:polysaccharide chain length determinant protein (PEP-CTERM system associated)